MRKEHYLSIGDFAKICDVSRKSLIFYDNIGLLKPALVKPNGYRYYAHWQIETITAITTLSGLGMSLEEIKCYLHHYDPEQTKQMLQKQDQVIEEKVEALRATQEMLRMRIQLIEEGMSASSEFRIVQQEETPLCISEPFYYDTNSIPDDLWVHFYNACEERHISFCYPICYVIKQEDILAGNYQMVSNLCFRISDRQKANGVMLAGRYLVGYGNFHYGDTFPLYEQMCRYAQQQQLEIGGDAYEEYLLDEMTSSCIEDYKVKLSIYLKE